MRALLLIISLAASAIGLVAFSNQSSFDTVNAADAAAVTGGTCYYITAWGCIKVINQNPDGRYELQGPGCDDAASGNTITTPGGRFATTGTGKWCSFWHTWSCGIYMNKRDFCDGTMSEVPGEEEELVIEILDGEF